MNKLFAVFLVGVWAFDGSGYLILPRIMPPPFIWALALPAMLLELWGWGKLYTYAHSLIMRHEKTLR